MPRALLLSDDEELVDFVRRVVQRPWGLVRQRADKFMTREILAQPNLRLAILDDQAVDENDRGRLLAQIRKHFSGVPLLYVAGSPNDGNEKRARANGAHYYISKPLSFDRFGQVLESFLHAQQVSGRVAPLEVRKSNMKAKESSSENPASTDHGIRRLWLELNREDSRLRSRLLDAALAGLRLERNPESRELRRDAAQLWATIERILTHHLDTEDKELLPWLEQHGSLPPEAGRKVSAYHDRLRTLIGAMDKAGAESLTEVQAR
ncbi:response regulator, partial [Candidatus Binatus sp.]|uniref:response regulator n=1 Tax=Candidatus Binatus sp. TaxID=2811406 RepID=UPI003CA67DE2